MLLMCEAPHCVAQRGLLLFLSLAKSRLLLLLLFEASHCVDGYGVALFLSLSRRCGDGSGRVGLRVVYPLLLFFYCTYCWDKCLSCIGIGVRVRRILPGDLGIQRTRQCVFALGIERRKDGCGLLSSRLHWIELNALDRST